MKIEQDDNNIPKVDLKQHQRFQRQVPWALIRKIIIVAVLGGMIYYLAKNIPSNQAPETDSIEVEIAE